MKFRRQHPLYNFITDFYCRELKIIIEIDGYVHKYQFARDEMRDRFFEKYGYTILRFNNEEVLNDLNNVIQRIKGAILKL